ncbi:unnamed protein product [Candida verbasci]|uniref:Uncharacterized protein n=1 Tax=Candida verbasci TaxID=1227364 RepID=A0A9W4TZX0_9ASCO|nr:unnamed protein product [Candida verbasci]
MPISDITSQYLNSLEKDNTGFSLNNNNNISPIKPNHKDNKDLDELARQLNISPTKQSQSSPLVVNKNVSNLFRTKFESPSATISSFKSSENHPSWANRNYKDVLNKSPTKTPLKQIKKPILDSPSSNSKPFFSSPSKSTSKHSPGYEYLCRIESIKNWLQQVLNEEIIQSSSELIKYIRNGIHLAKLSNVILPNKRNVFLNDSNLQFKHTENINRFFQLLDYLNMPDLFRFELTDLYDAKNVPKVWFCLHALSYILNKQDPQKYPKMLNLVDKLNFEDDDIRTADRALIGAPLPNFSSADSNEENDLDTNYMNKVTESSPIKFSPINKQTSMDNHFEEKQSEKKSVKFEIKSPIDTSFKIKSPNIETDANYQNSDYYTPELDYHVINIIKVQSLARGVNCRYSMFVKKILIKSYVEEFNVLFSVIRSNLSKSKTVHKHGNELRFYDYEIVELQSLIRKKLAIDKLPKEEFEENKIVKFQSILRGKIFRDRNESIKKGLSNSISTIVDFQSMSRMKLVYKKINKLISHKHKILPSIIQLQSISRSKLYLKFSISAQIEEKPIIQIQSIIRRNFVIQELNNKHLRTRSQKRKFIELQAIARGGISRTRLCNNVLINLIYEDDLLNELFAKVRGNKLRKETNQKKDSLKSLESSSILPVQTLFRGVLTRFHKEITLDDLYDQIDSIIKLQSITRGHIIRLRQHDYKQYYLKNVDLVIKAQSIIKRTLIQNAYKQLTTTTNPTLSVIRKFAYLLSNSESDFNKEMELTKLKDKIIEKSKINEDLECQIEQLDIKLGLLDKNKITIEEFVKPKKIKLNSNSIGNVKTLERLNKSARARIEIYQSLFYILQTNSIYFKRLYSSLSYSDKESKFNRDLFSSITTLFPIENGSINNHSREEFFYIKFVLDLMDLDARQSILLGDLTKVQKTYWIDYLYHFNNLTFQRQHLKKIVGKFVSSVIDDENLDFESDPTIINADVISREIKIHGSSTGNSNLSPQEAIQIPQVSNKFINNLISLREKANDLIYILQKCHIPIHVRILCKSAYDLSCRYFPDKSKLQHLAVSGVIFIKHYINLIFNHPENYGYKKEYPKCEDNLKHLSRVMLQIFSMKLFNDNFLKPLNDYITNSTETIKLFIIDLINISDVDSVYELSEYNDILNHEKPKLLMKINNMINLEKITVSNADIIAPYQHDPILKYVTDLESLNSSPSDFISLTDLSQLVLILNPQTHEDNLNDAKNKSLFTIAKRSLLYIIRVQEDGDDLLELLISGIKPEHEEKFKRIVAQEREEEDKKNPYYKQSIGDLTKLSYHELKKICLENLLKLESMGELTRKNSFQTLLNQTSVDIKTKDIQRSNRIQELKNYEQVIKKLTEKEKFLKKQLADYNSHIDMILTELTKKPKDKRVFFNIIPVFSKQYFYHRELRKRNRLPKFGSYKYSSKKLTDMKILIDYNFKGAFSSSKLEFMFSCHQIGKFTIEVANNSINIPGASNVISLDDLLNLQYENRVKFELFDGLATFDSNNFMAFIFSKFYDIKKH